jgi:hypothetical protein
MGHLINPVSFRLGYSRNWGFAGALMESKSQYFYLNGNYYNILLFFKRIFALQTFEKMGVIFSHIRFLSLYKKDIVILYLYDGPLQNDSFIFYKYLNKLKKIKNVLRYAKKFFKKFLRRAFFSFYYLQMFDNILNNLNIFLLNYLIFKLNNLMRIVALLKSNIKILDNIYFIRLFFTKDLVKKTLMPFFFLKNINMFFFNCLFFDFNLNFFLLLTQKFKLFSTDLIYSFMLICKSINFIMFYYKKYNIFFFVQMYNKLLTLKNNNFKRLFLIYKDILYTKSIFRKNIYNEFLFEIDYINNVVSKYKIYDSFNLIFKNFLFSFIEGFFEQRLRFYNFCKKLLFCIGNGQKKKFIFLNFFFKFFTYVSSNFFIFLKNIISIFKPFFFNIPSKNFLLYFKNITKKEINASLITKYICIRLKQRFSLKEVIRPILKDLTTNPLIQGFRLSCCGRFTKKEIATYKWERRGRISLNTINARIDYSFNYVILKYSVCGIKVWLHKNSTYKYFFKKWFENFKYFSNKRKYMNKNLRVKKNIKNKKFLYNRKFNRKKNYLNKKKSFIYCNKKIKSLLKFYKHLNNLQLKRSLKPFLINFKK